jgi:phosphoglycolate phosphatase-like HAD superfamily hydrolase
VANIIFDFDGTLADTLGVTIKIFEKLLRKGEPMPAEEVERLRGLPVWRVGMELRIRPWKVPYLLARGRAKMRREMKYVEIFPGMAETVRQLNADGHKLYILSSNSVHNIRPFLKRYKLSNEFIKVVGGAGVFGKRRLLKRTVRRYGFNPEQTYYVGDEIRDIDAARHAGIKVIVVTGGYNNEKALRGHDPDFVAKQPADIAKILTGQIKPL